MPFIRRTIGALATLTGAVASVASASPAAAAADPGYQQVTASYAFSTGWSYAGGYVGCPSGTRALSSGALSGDRLSALMSGATSYDGTRGYQTAWGHDGDPFLVRARCVAASRLTGTTPSTLTVRDQRGGFRSYVKQVACPTGTVAYGGGGNTLTGGAPSSKVYMYGSKPSGSAWTFAGAGELADSQLAIGTHCLPRTKLGKIVTVESTSTGPANPDRSLMAADARCPAGFFAFTGGAWYHPVGDPFPAWRGYLTQSDMDSDNRGWFAMGTTWSPNTQLTAKVRCTDRLG